MATTLLPDPFPVPDIGPEWMADHPGQPLPTPFPPAAVAEMPLLETWEAVGRFSIIGRDVVGFYSNADNSLFWGTGVAACKRAKNQANKSCAEGEDAVVQWEEHFLGAVAGRSAMLGIPVGAWWGTGGMQAAEALWAAIQNPASGLNFFWRAAQLLEIGGGGLLGTVPMILGVIIRTEQTEGEQPGDLNIGVVFSSAFNPVHCLMVLLALEQVDNLMAPEQVDNEDVGNRWSQGIKPLLASLPDTRLMRGEWGMIYDRSEFLPNPPAAAVDDAPSPSPSPPHSPSMEETPPSNHRQRALALMDARNREWEASLGPAEEDEDEESEDDE